MKTVLALDVATVTGWAFGPIIPGQGPSVSGYHRFGREGADDPRIWSAALVWLNQMIALHNPTLVALEAPINSASAGGGSNAGTMVRLIGLQAILRAVTELKLPVSARLVAVQSARKLFIGHGNLPSKEAKASVQARCLELGWLTEYTMQPDRADACALWAKACADADPDFAAAFPRALHQSRKVRA